MYSIYVLRTEYTEYHYRCRRCRGRHGRRVSDRVLRLESKPLRVTYYCSIALHWTCTVFETVTVTKLRPKYHIVVGTAVAPSVG